MKQPARLKDDQQGIVAIVVTILFMIIISLTALGLARIARREQRLALDNQLASQANYLAQTGVNDAIEAIKTAPYNTTDKTSCAGNDDLVYSGAANGSQLLFLNPIVGNPISEDASTALGITARGGYSCVLIQHATDSVEVNPVPTNKSALEDMQIVKQDGTNYTGNYDLVFSWSSANDTHTNFRSLPTLFPSNDPRAGANTWAANSPGILRVDVTKLDSFDRNALDANSATTFLYPSSGGGSPSSFPNISTISGLANRGAVAPGECNNTAPNPATKRFQDCNVAYTVTGSGVNRIFVRLKTMYDRDGSAVTITAYEAGTSNRLKIKGAQTVIDSTGKVSDVVKRLQVRVNQTPQFNYPEYALESVSGICKLIATIPSPGVTTYSSEASGADVSDQNVCNPAQP